MTGHSGICKYSRDFYDLVLKGKGYTFIDTHNQAASSILATILPSDHIHFEIGIFQKKEVDILFEILNANYQNVAVTLHDAPLLKYPFRRFENPFLNNVSKFYDIYVNKFAAAGHYINKIKTIYVLSNKGVELIKSKYRVNHVYFLPHIISQKEIKKSDSNNNNFIYFGFIGKNKGIEYSLRLHQQLLVKYSDMNFYIVGTAIGKEKHYYNYLKEKYTNNVHFLGYVPDDKLDAIFDKASFSLMLFKPYRFFYPFSGSIIFNLKKGKILFTNKVNVVSEIITEGLNGFFLSGEMEKDVSIVSTTIMNRQKLDKVKEASYNYLLQNHTSKVVSENLNSII